MTTYRLWMTYCDPTPHGKPNQKNIEAETYEEAAQKFAGENNLSVDSMERVDQFVTVWFVHNEDGTASQYDIHWD